MTRKFARLVVLSTLTHFAAVVRPEPLYAQAHPAPPCAAGAGELQTFNIQLDEMLRQPVTALLAKSSTFRRQWRQIASAPGVRVVVVARTDLRETPSARARGQVSRYAYGAVRAMIEIPAAADLAELLPHEFEHVLEQMEGLDLALLARTGDRGVIEVDDGVFETTRARAAGRAAAREVYGDTDPAIGAAARSINRIWQALWTRPSPDLRPAPGPPSRR